MTNGQVETRPKKPFIEIAYKKLRIILWDHPQWWVFAMIIAGVLGYVAIQ